VKGVITKQPVVGLSALGSTGKG